MNHAVQQHIPEGYLQDQAGRLVPIELIDEIDLTRNDLVQEIVIKARELQQAMATFKLNTLGDISAFVDLSAERYSVKMGGKKGNISLLSYDGKYKIQRAISEYIVFDERLQVAKELIDGCIHRWAEGSDNKIKVLVDHAFQVDKEGNISTGRVLGLRRIKIDDSEWSKAMAAIADSIQIAGSKTYVRLYERVGESEQYQPISLDIAAL
ncbi:Protein of unknown function [Amphritea atlantica]|uniref:Sulfate transporter n=1 Tax=Amphritea atlantica TaxID=355243 RepID=A0A1H9EGD3_9GAMM|nr:DUF3164 family protein [Amphritea atlantica]SEQ24088.1 Protein of unknown function [Amphritea atlantica]